MPVTGITHPPVEEIIHGVVVRDPYRWLEDRSLPETEEWICEQQRKCDTYFAECKDLDSIRERVRAYLDVEVVDQPVRMEDCYFYRRRSAGEEQACIYTRDATTGVEKLIVAPSTDGPLVSIGIHQIAADGSLLAYERRYGGEDKKSIHIVDVETGAALPDHIARGYARGFTFTQDGNGFFYCQETSATADEHTIYLHLFHESAEDQVVFRAARSNGSRLVLIADRSHLGAIWVHRHGSDLAIDLWIAKRDVPTAWQQVFADREPSFHPILKFGRIFALIYDDCPNGKLIELNSEGKVLRTIVPERNSMIRRLVMASGRIYTSYLDNMVPSIHMWSESGDNLGAIDIPMDGTIQLLPSHSGEDSLFYAYESCMQPPIIYEYTPDSGQSCVWFRRSLPFELNPLKVKRISYTSSDGVEVLMTLASNQDRDTSGNSPVIMTSYGGFAVPVTPQFSVLVAILLELGAIFALPNIRGGSEHGRAWHDAARGRKRQRSFDDFIAAAEWLCSQGITAPQHLAIFGGSNSGLLVGAAMTKRPDLFRAVLCIAPLLDMVRYEHFDQAMRWQHEYGTVDDAKDFQALYAYSPYHHIQEGTGYPAVMFVTGDKDNRCNPAHVRKMAERLEENHSQRLPIVVDYSSERGHSPVLPLSVRLEALTRRIAFLCNELRLPLISDGGRS